jgi:cystine transport system substrate-binding protein
LGTLAAFPDDGKAQQSQKQASGRPPYESQTMTPEGKSCYGPRLLTTHSTSDAARLAAVLTGLLLVATVPVALAAVASPTPAPQVSELRLKADSIEARANAAAVELYALEAELGHARRSLSAVSARRATLAQERATVQRELRIARRAVRVSELRLAQLLRALYEQPGGADPLAILLGAESLEEAMAGLDQLSRAAGEHTRVIEQARSSREKLGALDARLARRQAELGQLAAAAAAHAEALARTRAERSRFLADLRLQQGLTGARIASIESQAREAEARTLAIYEPPAQAAPSAAVTAAAPAPPPVVPPASADRTLTVTATGYALRGRTATGMRTVYGVVAVDPSVIPLGTRLSIPGYGEGIAADTGGAVHGNTIDLWFPTTAKALEWGRRTVTITLG